MKNGPLVANVKKLAGNKIWFFVKENALPDVYV